MRAFLLLVLPVAFLGCGPRPGDKVKVQEMKVYLLKVVEAQKRYHAANETYSLNMQELFDFDGSVGEPPAGYKVKGGGRLAMAFGFEVEATPEALGPHLYVNQSGVVRYSYWGAANAESDIVE
jgi:hypothetical protein